MLFDKLETVEGKYEELMASLGTAAVQSDANEFRKQSKALAEIEELVQKYREYKAVSQEIAGTEEMIKGGDPEMRELALEELNDLNVRKDRLSDQIKILLVPKDPNDDRNVMVEIRAGTGGEEAALFASELYRAYVRYAERQRWKVELMSLSEADKGGVKDVVVARFPHQLGFTVKGCAPGRGVVAPDLPAALRLLRTSGRCTSCLLESWPEPGADRAETIRREDAWAAEGAAWLRRLVLS